MSYLRLEKATDQERELLSLIRALSWRGNLSDQEFQDRNRKLYNHPFGRQKITTYVLKNPENKIVSSLDALQIKLFVKKGGQGSAAIQDGFLIASFMTPPQHRRKGYATLLLNRFFEVQPLSIGVLYSDIGPKFYERWGFKISKRFVFEISGPFTKNQLTINPLEPKRWVEKVFDFRKSKLDQDPKAHIAVVPDIDFYDWQIERFRFFAQLRSQNSLPPVFYEALTPDGPSYFAVILNALTGKAEVLWRDTANKEGLAAIGQVVEGWGCGSFTYWGAEGEGQKVHEENPMHWTKGAGDPHQDGFYDPQLSDWW